MKKCTTCNKVVTNEKTEFKCPDCGKETIIRCDSCKKSSKIYTCPGCGFVGPWVIKMGKAMVIFKISPEPEQIDQVEAAVKAISIPDVKFQDIKREPLAFGIEIIKVGYIVPDKTDGIIPALEEALNKIEGLTQEAEMQGATLIS